MAGEIQGPVPSGFFVVTRHDNVDVMMAVDDVAGVGPRAGKKTDGGAVIRSRADGLELEVTTPLDVVVERIAAARAASITRQAGVVTDRIRTTEEAEAVAWLRSVAAYQGTYSIHDGEMARRLVAALVNRGIGLIP